MNIALFAALTLAPSVVAFGADALTIGSPAPKPDVEHWTRGEKPEFFKPGKVYVVEFWATWCPPCRASMPHLSELFDKYHPKGVEIIGISDEKIATVDTFLNKDEWKEKARYTLGTDPDRSTYKAYMEAAAQNGIPTAFIVKDNTVQWIGHPMSIDKPLEQVVAGTWDMKAYKETFEPTQIEARGAMERNAKLTKAMAAKDWDSVIKIFDDGIASAKGPRQAQLQMQKFSLLLTDANRPDAAYALGREMASTNRENGEILNQLAWFVLDNKGVKTRDLNFALTTAQSAVTATKGENAAVLDTLARAYWDTGDKKMAVETEMRAVKLGGDDAMAKEITETLEKYKSGTPPAAPTARKSS